MKPKYSTHTNSTNSDGQLEAELKCERRNANGANWETRWGGGGCSRADAHFTPGLLFVDRLGGWDWRVMLMEAYIYARANREGHGEKKKSPLRCLAVCKLQLNSTNRHTERWIIARDTKVLAVHTATASSPETTWSLSCLLHTQKYNLQLYF